MTAPVTSPELAALRTLAERHGVLTSYEDTARTRREPAADVLVGVLAALGLPIEAVTDAPRLLDEPGAPEPVLPPVHVTTPDTASDLPLSTPVARGRWRIVDDDGTEAVAGDLDDAGRLRLPPLPVGFWTLDLELGDGTGSPERAECRLLVAPPVAPRPSHLRRTWGVFAPLYALREPDRAGHLGDVDRLAGLIAPHGGRIVSLLPLLATFLGNEPYEYSPYQPVSRRFFSELYVDPTRLPVAGDAPVLPPAAPTGDGLVDYPALARRAEILVDDVRTRLAGQPGARAHLEAFRAEHPDVDHYAAFRAAVERHGARPPRLDGDPGRVEHHVVAQWLMFRQLADLRDRLGRRGQAMALDLPVGCHPDGYDTFLRPDLYAPVATGAPPDEFFQGGQNWGFPPMDPVAARVDGHREFAAYVEVLARHAGVVRVDHILGLNRLWWIPPGGRADEGAYVRYPLHELLAVLRIVAHRHDAVIVGENLGTVPPEVTRAMADSGILGMHEEQFVVGGPPEDALPEIAEPTVAGINTHDMVPFAGFWDGVDLRDHVELGFRDQDDLPHALAERREAIEQYRTLVSAELGRPVPDDRDAVLAAVVERLARSDADQVMLTLEDVWGETEPQNVPGTHRERPNWRRRLAHAVDDAGPPAEALFTALGHRSPTPVPGGTP